MMDNQNQDGECARRSFVMNTCLVVLFLITMVMLAVGLVLNIYIIDLYSGLDLNYKMDKIANTVFLIATMLCLIAGMLTAYMSESNLRTTIRMIIGILLATALAYSFVMMLSMEATSSIRTDLRTNLVEHHSHKFDYMLKQMEHAEGALMDFAAPKNLEALNHPLIMELRLSVKKLAANIFLDENSALTRRGIKDKKQYTEFLRKEYKDLYDKLAAQSFSEIEVVLYNKLIADLAKNINIRDNQTAAFELGPDGRYKVNMKSVPQDYDAFVESIWNTLRGMYPGPEVERFINRLKETQDSIIASIEYIGDQKSEKWLDQFHRIESNHDCVGVISKEDYSIDYLTTEAQTQIGCGWVFSGIEYGSRFGMFALIMYVIIFCATYILSPYGPSSTVIIPTARAVKI